MESTVNDYSILFIFFLLSVISLDLMITQSCFSPLLSVINLHFKTEVNQFQPCQHIATDKKNKKTTFDFFQFLETVDILLEQPLGFRAQTSGNFLLVFRVAHLRTNMANTCWQRITLLAHCFKYDQSLFSSSGKTFKEKASHNIWGIHLSSVHLTRWLLFRYSQS